jgi:hypothetical protein
MHVQRRSTARYQVLAGGFLIGALMLGSPSIASATVIALQPNGAAGKDAEINSEFPDAATGLFETYLIVHWAGNARSIGLIEFDLSGIPSGSTISSATLSLFHHANSCLGCEYDVFQVITSWAEATVTFNTRPLLHPVPVASLVIGDSATQVFRSWDVTSLVSGWVSGAFTNDGMSIEEVPVMGSAAVYFASSDNPTAANWPTLTIDYTAAVAAVPEPGTLALFGISLLGLAAFRRRRKLERAPE